MVVWRRRFRNGRSWIHIGYGTQTAVGSQHPSDSIPLQEGLKLLGAYAVERIWGSFRTARTIRRTIRQVKKAGK